MSLASLLIFAVAMEVGLGMAGYGKLEVYDPDEFVFWRLRPNQDCFTKVDHRPVHINSRGTRGPEFEIPKPRGVVRVLSIGDSSTFGWGLSDEETYSRLLEKKLNAAGRKVEVINAGCNGWGYPQLKSFFKHYGRAFEADYLLIAGANYWTDFTEEASPEFKRSMKRRVLLKNVVRRSAIYHFIFERQMSVLYFRLRARFVPLDPTKEKNVSAQTYDPLKQIDKELRELVELARTNGVRPVMLTIPPNSWFTNKLAVDILETRRKVCGEAGVPEVNLSRTNWPPAGKEFYLEGDAVHPNAAGNEAVAEELGALFKELFRK